MKNEKMYWTTVLEGVKWLRKFDEMNVRVEAVRQNIRDLDTNAKDYWSEKKYQESVLRNLDHQRRQFAFAIEALAQLVDKLFGVRYDDYQQEVHKQLDKQRASQKKEEESKPSNEEVKLTDLQKETLRNLFGYGFAFDDLDSSFICWGMPEGKRMRGTVPSLEKKGCLSVTHSEDDTIVGTAKYTKRQLLKMCEYPGWERYQK